MNRLLTRRVVTQLIPQVRVYTTRSYQPSPITNTFIGWDVENRKLSKDYNLSHVKGAVMRICSQCGIPYGDTTRINVFGCSEQITNRMQNEFSRYAFNHFPTPKGPNAADKEMEGSIQRWMESVEALNMKNTLVIIISNDKGYSELVKELLRRGHRVIVLVGEDGDNYKPQIQAKETESGDNRAMAVISNIKIPDDGETKQHKVKLDERLKKDGNRVMAVSTEIGLKAIIDPIDVYEWEEVLKEQKEVFQVKLMLSQQIKLGIVV